MGKTVFVVFSIIIVLVSVTIAFVQGNVQAQKSVFMFNSTYETYLNRTLLGTEVATLIGRAIENNEKNKIEKNEKGVYIPDGQYSIKVHINLLGSQNTYEMETINSVGMSEFVANFNTLEFQCTKILYHNLTKRVSDIYIREIGEE